MCCKTIATIVFASATILYINWEHLTVTSSICHSLETSVCRLLTMSSLVCGDDQPTTTPCSTATDQDMVNRLNLLSKYVGEHGSSINVSLIQRVCDTTKPMTPNLVQQLCESYNESYDVASMLSTMSLDDKKVAATKNAPTPGCVPLLEYGDLTSIGLSDKDACNAARAIEDGVKQLMDMGFDQSSVTHALSAVQGDVDKAITLLLQ